MKKLLISALIALVPGLVLAYVPPKPRLKAPPKRWQPSLLHSKK